MNRPALGQVAFCFIKGEKMIDNFSIFTEKKDRAHVSMIGMESFKAGEPQKDTGN